MRVRWSRLVLILVLVLAAPARAQQVTLTGPLHDVHTLPLRRHRRPPPDELHVFQRVGFAYHALLHAPALSTSLGTTYEVLHITPRLSLSVATDIDDRRDPVGTTSFGAGVALLHATPSGVAFEVDSIVSGNWDGSAFSGAGASVRLSFTPFYLPISLVDRCVGGPVTAFLASAISLWTLGRMDWGASHGGTLAFGVAIDWMHALVDPIVVGSRGDWRRCVRRRL
jgi:hypothetical protein